ncbi:MAG: cytochrome c peroxidase [Minicystis sp.]
MRRSALVLLSLAACSAPRASEAPRPAPAPESTALPARFPLPAVLPARYLRTLEHDPGGYDASAPPGGPARGDATDLLLGDLLYHAPSTLGPRARALGLSCQSCHPNGAANTAFVIQGLGDRPGNVDLTTRFFRSGAADDIDNPVNIPSLRGARFTAPYGHDGRTASLAEFTQGVISGEFDGDPLGPRELGALVRYVQELDFLPNKNVDKRSQLTPLASEAAHLGEAIFRRPMAGFDGASCATCHVPSTFFRDGRAHRIGAETPPVPSAIEEGQETPTLLGLAETAPYFHDGRFATLREVVVWFDRAYGLALERAEIDALTAYVEAVGAVDRPRDDRPLARKLSQTFAYAALLADPEARVRSAAREAVLVELAGAPPAVADRARALGAELRALSIDRAPLEAPRARALRHDLTHLAADWSGALPPP